MGVVVMFFVVKEFFGGVVVIVWGIFEFFEDIIFGIFGIVGFFIFNSVLLKIYWNMFLCV